jgi:hypothetical protein
MSVSHGAQPVFITTLELADRWKISGRTLEGWRDKGIGPAYVKIGSRVRYHIDDIARAESASRSFI